MHSELHLSPKRNHGQLMAEFKSAGRLQSKHPSIHDYVWQVQLSPAWPAHQGLGTSR